MEKLDLKTPNFTNENIAKLAELFPNCVTEKKNDKGEIVRAIDFDTLRQEYSGTIVEGAQERYSLNWPGKREALVTANTPISKTLRPCRDESVDFDNTKNIFIEGDNLDALKLLQETYLAKVKMIYIDPPYNTGKDFIYKDNFTVEKNEYEAASGQRDEDGGRLVANLDSNGRYHSEWLSMIYPRLKLARNLLSDDGVIFVTIDDNEADNLKKVLDETFGAENYRGTIIWQHSVQPKGYSGTFSVHHNIIFCYAKSDKFTLSNLERTEEHNKNYSNPDNDPNGDWRTGDVRNALYRPNLIYDILTPSGKTIKPPDKGWRWSKATLDQKIESGEIIFSNDETRIIRKIYLKSLDGRTPETILFGKDVGTTREGAKEIKEIFEGKQPFDTPKPTKLIRHLINLSGANDGEVIVDFFAGSSSTAHAVEIHNAVNSYNLQYVMIQLPEECDENSEAYKMGFDNIAKISKERIRRAGNKIKEDNADKEGIENLDVGFRVFKIDSSNMVDVTLSPDEAHPDMFEEHVGNIKKDRSSEDLLFQVLLDWGVDLTLPIERVEIGGKEVFFVDENALAACFDKDINEDFVKELAEKQPLRVVFRDDGFATDAVKINVEQIFKLKSPATDIKVI